MKLYDYTPAPNPRRARIFIAEKGLDIEIIQVDMSKSEQFSDAFKRINPRCTIPVLELDDGTCLTENTAIAVYLEAYAPDPPLLGTNPAEKGLIANWNARAELEGLSAVADAVRNQLKAMAGRAVTGQTGYPQIPELAQRGLARAAEFFDMLNARLGESQYLAGDSFSLADITAFVVTDFAPFIKSGPTDAHVHTKRWQQAINQRPSAKA